MHGPTRKLPALLLLRDRFCTDRGGAIVQLPRIGHLAYSAPADYATGTDAVDYRKLQATASRSYSVCRTTQLGSFSRHQDDPFVEDVTLDSRSAEDRLPSGSANVQSAQHVHPGVPSSPNPGSTIGHHDAVSAVYDDDICKACLPMLSSSCLDLRKIVLNSDSVTVFKFRLKTFLFS